MSEIHSTAPFVIVGVQRSGTTMLRLMLNAHSRLTVPFESTFIPKFYERLFHYGDLGCKENARRILQDIAKDRFVQRGGLLTDIDAILDYPILSKSDRAIFDRFAGDALELFGYERSTCGEGVLARPRTQLRMLQYMIWRQ